MASVDIEWDAQQIRSELRSAIHLLSHYCLKRAAKWACEQLIGLPELDDDDGIYHDDDDVSIDMAPQQLLWTPPQLPIMSSNEQYAKSLLELGEYAHAAAILSQPASHIHLIAPALPHLSPYGIYLRAYSMYLAGEQRASQAQLELQTTGSSTVNSATSVTSSKNKNGNPFLQQLQTELAEYHKKGKLDAFGLYVYGMVLKDKDLGNEILIESLQQFPCNWSAWLDLVDCKVVPEDLLQQQFGSHYMYHFYSAHVLLHTQQQHEASIAVYERLVQPDEEPLFAGSPYVASQLAVAHYHTRAFSLSEHCFVQLHQRDPYRLEDMDIYSNILYVHNQGMALSELAHTAMRVDKYRPETCCIVGNYYSLKNLRTKAITYFQRALKLNPSYTGAWTLMGHEYVELKNTPAAMEAYRKAADISPHDYRAWYGLGQAYEILGMPLYALYYYKKASTIRPYDARMWSAVAGCYLALGQTQEAMLTYEKALHDDVEGTATSQLAQLYLQKGQADSAASCFEKHLTLRYLATNAHPTEKPALVDVLQGVVVQAPDARALLFLAQHYQSQGELETATLCASRLLEYPGPEKEEGKAVLREIRSRRGL